MLITASVIGNLPKFTTAYLIRSEELIHNGNLIVWTPADVRGKNRVRYSAQGSSLHREIGE